MTFEMPVHSLSTFAGILRQKPGDFKLVGNPRREGHLRDRKRFSSPEPHRRLPHKRQQQEEQRDDRQDVDQGPKRLVGLRQLGDGGMEGESGQQRESHEREG